MSNLGYARFRNTLSDLRDCYESMGDFDLSEEEQAARRRLISLCKEIVADYGEEEED